MAYSYEAPIGLLIADKNPGGTVRGVILCACKYSVTTSGHQSSVWSAARHVEPTVRVPDLSVLLRECGMPEGVELNGARAASPTDCLKFIERFARTESGAPRLKADQWAYVSRTLSLESAITLGGLYGVPDCARRVGAAFKRAEKRDSAEAKRAAKAALDVAVTSAKRILDTPLPTASDYARGTYQAAERWRDATVKDVRRIRRDAKPGLSTLRWKRLGEVVKAHVAAEAEYVANATELKRLAALQDVRDKARAAIKVLRAFNAGHDVESLVNGGTCDDTAIATRCPCRAGTVSRQQARRLFQRHGVGNGRAREAGD